MKRLTVFWALLACLLLAAPAMAVETTATGKVVATVTRDVRLPFNAVIDEVLVRPGMPSRPGIRWCVIICRTRPNACCSAK